MIDFEREGMARVAVIKEVMEHPNADRLDIVQINEWQCVTAKETFKKNDLCIYFEIDSILPMEVESKIFGVDSKVKLSKSRVRTIKLRGAISQGLAVPLDALDIDPNKVKDGKDLTKHFGIGKNVPAPKKDSVLYVCGKKFNTSTRNPNFKKMRKPVHLKNVGGFKEPVMITEKIHCTSFVAGWIERPSDSIAKKINKFLFGDFQFCYRSMNVQLQGRDSLWHNISKILFGGSDPKMEDTLYGRMCIKYDLKNCLDFGEAISAEIYGSGIQANYSYGCMVDEHKIAGFGFRVDGKEQAPISAHESLWLADIPTVPILFTGDMPDDLTEYTTGASVLDPNTKVREGCVVNTLSGDKGWHGCALIKDINPAYLLMKDNTEFN